MYTAVGSTPDRSTDPLPMRSQSSIDGKPPVAGTLAGRPATTGAQRGAILHAGFGSWSDDEVQMKRLTDDMPSSAALRRTSGYVSDETSDFDKGVYVTERRQPRDNGSLLLKSPEDFKEPKGAWEGGHLPAARADGGAPFMLTEDKLLGLLRRASEEAYSSVVGRRYRDADEEESVKHRSSLRRSRIDGALSPSTKGQETQRPSRSSVSRTPSPEVWHDARPPRVRWRSPSVSGRSDDEYFDASLSLSQSTSRDSRAADDLSAQEDVGGKRLFNARSSEQGCRRRSTSEEDNSENQNSKKKTGRPPTVGRGGLTRSSKWMKPDKFDGKGSVETFLAQLTFVLTTTDGVTWIVPHT